MAYDLLGRKTAMSDPDMGQWSFTYDADGNRVRSVADGQETVYVGDWVESGVMYYHFGGQLVVRANGHLGPTAPPRWTLLHDHLGSATQAISDTAGTATTQRYYPYGAQRGGGEVNTPYQYTGQKWEENDALEVYYYKARWYDPALRRFLQPDTIVPEPGNPQSLNRYAYGLNNPVKFADPTGHWVETALDIAGIAYDVYEINRDGLNWVNGIALAADVACAVLPVAAGGGMLVRALSKTDDVVDAARAVGAVSDAVAHSDEVVDAARLAASKLDDVKRVRVYRVEGSINRRVTVRTGGIVEIAGDKTLFLNFGDEKRALEFFEKRLSQGLDDAAIKSFDVPADFLDQIRSSAVPEQLAREFPNAPIAVDITKAADQYGLRPEQIEQLIAAIIQGSGTVWP